MSHGDKPERSYHHGDLARTLVDIASARVAKGEPIALRAIALEAGVSATATYRHFANKEALESAVAAKGYRQLTEALEHARPAALTRENLWELACAYVDFALLNRAMFSLMMSSECDPTSPVRLDAVATLRACVTDAITPLWPEYSDSQEKLESLIFSLWSWIHGCAMLHLEGKVPAEDSQQIRNRVRAAWELTGFAH